TGQLVGPVIATVVLATGGYAWAFAINAATFLAPIAAMAFLYRRHLAGAVGGDAASAAQRHQSLTAYVRSQPWIAFILLAVVMTSAVTEVIRTTAPVLVTQRLGAPSRGAGPRPRPAHVLPSDRAPRQSPVHGTRRRRARGDVRRAGRVHRRDGRRAHRPARRARRVAQPRCRIGSCERRAGAVNGARVTV